jgi:hypothetical protein
VIDRLLVSHRFGIIRYLDFLQDIAVFHTLDCYRLFSDITSLKTERWTQHIVSTLFIIVFNTPEFLKDGYYVAIVGDFQV